MPPKNKTAVRRTAAPKSLTTVRPSLTAATAAGVKAAVAAPAAAPAVTAPAVAAPAVVGPTVAAPTATPAVASITKPVGAPVVAPVATPAAPLPADLLAGLRDASAETAVEAAAALGKLGDRRAIEPLLATLSNADGYCHVVTRAAAAMALAGFDDAKVVAALMTAARDPMAEVSREAVLSLGELKAAAATELLLEIVRNDSGYYVGVARHAAVRSLGKLKAASARDMLTALSTSTTEEPALTNAARDTLARI